MPKPPIPTYIGEPSGEVANYKGLFVGLLILAILIVGYFVVKAINKPKGGTYTTLNNPGDRYEG